MDSLQQRPAVDADAEFERVAMERPADCLTMTGRIVCVRPIVPGDAPALLAPHQRLSRHNRYLRFFSAGRARGTRSG
jgi:hypothetical protein